jgi:HEPN domain-containing protein
MRPMTREWVAKAESDYDGACEALRSRKKSRRDRICFFSQQCVEKYLKARLTEAGTAFPRTHELSVLLRLCLPAEPLWATFDRAFAAMAQNAVLIRYPGTWATLAEARQGIATCRRFRSVARQSLGLPR